ncbi:MAG: hypothetical protein DRN27_10140 [Thermoplasmata archaeon]|nr:MAG: hypothetical protein DRN27_10140 [Thermoplasmata archaeon]
METKKVLIYNHNYTFSKDARLHTNPYSEEHTCDLSYFVDSTSYSKIAIFNLLPANIDEAKLILNRIKDCADQVIIYSVEVNPITLELILDFDHLNFSFVINGFLNVNLQNASIYNQNFWLINSRFLYIAKYPYILRDKHDSFTNKPFYFEVMYGVPRIHREFVHNIIKDDDKFYKTEFLTTSSVWSDCLQLNTEIWEDEISAIPNQKEFVMYMGEELNLAQIIPLKIYKKAAYSIICETWWDNRFSFFTEKIAKPILAQRLFIVISGRHYLKNLRKLGFRTFDGIIDESYDDEPNNDKRWNKAIESANALCELDQETVLRQCAGIFIHNYRVLEAMPFHQVEDVLTSEIIKSLV